MMKKHIMSSKFQFLIDNGFSMSCDNAASIVYTYSFIKDIARIVISEDIREHFVNIKLVNSKRKTLLLIEYDGVIKNADFIGFDNLIESVNLIYEKSKNEFRGFTKKHFVKIVDLYADFVSNNIEWLL